MNKLMIKSLDNLDLINFWFTAHKNPIKWLGNNNNFDKIIKEKYQNDLNYIEKNINKNSIIFDFDDKYKCLEIIILMDQIPRHIYRNNIKAFQFEELVKNIVYKNINYLDEFNFYENVFFLMPLVHSENIIDKDNVINYYIKILEKFPEFNNRINRFIKMIKLRKEILEKFNRFPKRHYLIKEKLSSEELEYIENKGLF